MSMLRPVIRELKRYGGAGNIKGFMNLFNKALNGEYGQFVIVNRRSGKKVLNIEDAKIETAPMLLVKYDGGRGSSMLLKNFFNNIVIREWDKWEEDLEDDEFDPDFWDRMGVKV